jgi:L-2,4-diaminobutyric acid acetyltransferase
MDALIPTLGGRGGLGEKPIFSLRSPVVEDGVAISRLIAACPPLDRNSVYCTLLQCSHFAGTCALAERNSRIGGWASAYIPPAQADVLFVWQAAVAKEARGQKLAARLIEHILARAICRNVVRLQTTITIDNEASWRLFRNFADQHDAAFHAQPHFFREAHFGGAHETEHLVTIGPFADANGRRR